MKITRKQLFILLISIVGVALCFVIATTFFYSTLNFKTYYEYANTANNKNEQQIIYTLDDDNSIIYLVNKKGNISIERIVDKNVEPEKLFNFEIDENKTSELDFYKKGDFYYLFYDNGKSFKKIDCGELTIRNYEDIPNGILTISEYDNLAYICNESVLYSLASSNSLNNIIEIPESISSIKKFDFINQYNIIISTYNSELFTLDLSDGSFNKLSSTYQEYVVNKGNLYFVELVGDKLKINSYINNEMNSFLVDRCEYITLKCVDDYLYLVNTDAIYKVSLSRKKRHEDLKMSNYSKASYNLSNVLIVSEKLMYLPMIKEDYNYKESSNVYHYHLYRYKKGSQE